MKNCIEEYSTKELHDELIKRGGIEQRERKSSI